MGQLQESLFTITKNDSTSSPLSLFWTDFAIKDYSESVCAFAIQQPNNFQRQTNKTFIVKHMEYKFNNHFILNGILVKPFSTVLHYIL